MARGKNVNGVLSFSWWLSKKVYSVYIFVEMLNLGVYIDVCIHFGINKWMKRDTVYLVNVAVWLWC